MYFLMQRYKKKENQYKNQLKIYLVEVVHQECFSGLIYTVEYWRKHGFHSFQNKLNIIKISFLPICFA